MSVGSDGERQKQPSLAPWDPVQYIRGADTRSVALSRGYLRCRPERWFPGFGAHWLPLAHSLGVEMKIIESKPILVAPRGLDFSFSASIDNEPFAIGMDLAGMDTVMNVVIPGGNRSAKKVVAEYFARRLITSLALCWSGPESSIVRFNAEKDPEEFRYAGAVKVTTVINGTNCVFWLMLGPVIIDRLDGLWRRQVQSSARGNQGGSVLHLEIAQLVVPPSVLSDYLKSGTVIDLEILVTDSITLSASGSPWLPAKLCNVDGRLGFEILAGPVTPISIPSGMTRLSIEFDSLALGQNQMAELAQIGAMWDCGSGLTNSVNMVINEEVVGRGTLCTYEGRFAISVE